MMQHVATVKSDVAAFATGAESSSFKGSESNEQFGKLLQDQKSLDTLSGSSELAAPYSSNDKTLDARETTPSPSPSSATSSAANVDSVSESVANNLNDELKDSHTEAGGHLVLSSKHNDTESSSIISQEWVSLVDDLQKLADVGWTSKQSLVNDEIQPINIPEADLKLDSKIAESISILVGKALGEVLKNTEEGLVDTDIRQKVGVLLLEQPQVLQNLISKLQIYSQKSGTDTSEQKTLNTAIDPVIEKEVLLANHQVESDAQLNLTFADNKDLLRTLLILEDSQIVTNPLQQPVKLDKSVLPDASEKLTQLQQGETLISKLESVAEQGALFEQETQMSQVVTNNQLNVSKVDSMNSKNDIKNILSLTDNKLDKVLENIAQRVFDTKNTDELITPEQIALQVTIPKVSEISSSVGSQSKDFISALKSGLDEYKNQLSQGREPGIDLKALVADALAKTTDTGAVAKGPINLEQMINSVSQVFDLAQTINRAIEHQHDQVYSATLRDASQIQGEQSKQIQLNQFEFKYQKAINIAKPEGHQQLAEKVRWMVNTKNLVAEIRLDPAELGSVHIKVAVSGESATVNFVVQSLQARDAVDTATPRLREMLAEKGIELGQSSVREENDGQQGKEDGELARDGGHAFGDSEDVDVSEQVLAEQNIVNGALGGIDYFV
jgi:flagellar hook-length control protein FliK